PSTNPACEPRPSSQSRRSSAGSAGVSAPRSARLTRRSSTAASASSPKLRSQDGTLAPSKISTESNIYSLGASRHRPPGPPPGHSHRAGRPLEHREGAGPAPPADHLHPQAGGSSQHGTSAGLGSRRPDARPPVGGPALGAKGPPYGRSG